VRGIRVTLSRDAQGLELFIDRGRQRGQIGRSLDAGPENARAAIVGKEMESTEAQRAYGKTADFAECVANRVHCRRTDFANELESHMKIVRVNPANLVLGRGRIPETKAIHESRQSVANRGRNLERDEQAHDQARLEDGKAVPVLEPL
jgi:hypothetical protein